MQNVRGIFGIRWTYVVEYAIKRSVVNTASGTLKHAKSRQTQIVLVLGDDVV